jgi:hypothetical protein
MTTVLAAISNYSRAIYRIAATIRVLLFMTLSILIFDFYSVTAVMIVLIAVLNDFPIMTIAYDNAPIAERPVRWGMHRVLTISTVLGIVSSFGVFWAAQRNFRFPRHFIQTLIFLKLLIAGHLTIYLTRNTGTSGSARCRIGGCSPPPRRPRSSARWRWFTAGSSSRSDGRVRWRSGLMRWRGV